MVDGGSEGDGRECGEGKVERVMEKKGSDW